MTGGPVESCLPPDASGTDEAIAALAERVDAVRSDAVGAESSPIKKPGTSVRMHASRDAIIGSKILAATGSDKQRQAAPGGAPAPRILIVRLSAIGDTIHSLPLAAALRQAFPAAYIGWLVEKPSAALIENNPLLDWHHVLPKGWLKFLSRVRALAGTLRAERFDIAFDIQGLTKSAVAARLSGAGTRIGFTRGEARELAPLLDNLLVKPQGRHAVDMTLSLLRGIGLSPPARGEFVFPPPGESDRAAVDRVVNSDKYQDGFVLMGPWGSFAAKLWPLDRFRDVAVRIRAETGLHCLMLGHGDAERNRVEELAATAPDALSPAPDVSLTGVVELARRARLFVGCDSFPMHAAAAVGCHTLGIFAVTDPARLGPYGPTGRSIYDTLVLPKSTRERRKLDDSCIKRLTVEPVLRACLEMIRAQ
ncbi:MAG: glycosyltransferase family 9 protein [Planctomycetes bacterium]|nr:glycosyltransferase family 9 protein [Planctomycetota bacterium]